MNDSKVTVIVFFKQQLFIRTATPFKSLHISETKVCTAVVGYNDIIYRKYKENPRWSVRNNFLNLLI